MAVAVARRVCTETIPSGCVPPLNPATSGQADPHIRGCRDAARSACARRMALAAKAPAQGPICKDCLPDCRSYRSASAQGAAARSWCTAVGAPSTRASHWHFTP